MPYYTSILKASSLPPSCYLDLVSLLTNNPHNLPLASLVARIVRENALQWVLSNIPTTLEQTNLTLIDVEKKFMHLLSLIMEMIVASEIASEDLESIISIKQTLMTSMSLLDKISDIKKKRHLSELNACVWEIYTTAKGYSCSAELSSLGNTLPWIIWAQAYLKLARSYYIPQGQNKIGLEEYLKCLDEASAKFQQCLELAEETKAQWQNRTSSVSYIQTHPWSKQPDYTKKIHTMNMSIHEALCGVAYCMFMRARVTQGTVNDNPTKRELLVEAKKLFNKAFSISPSKNSAYNLACIACLMEYEDECCMWLKEALRENNLPSSSHLLADPDFVSVREKSWFKSIVSKQTEKEKVPQQNTLQSAVFVADVTSSVLRDTPAQFTPLQLVNGAPVAGPKPSSQQNVINMNNSRGEVIYTNDAALNTLLNYDQEINALQASLLRDGFSINTVIQMITEVSKGKLQHLADADKIKKQKERLEQRLKLLNMKEKTVIPADGNCQMHSLSDQLYDTIAKSAEVRSMIVQWLRANPDWKLPNGAVMRDFVCTSWNEYCDEMARDGIWGDHLTLTAATEIFGVKIVIVSSIEGDNYLTEILPTKATVTRVLYLSHYAEFHYGSICPVE